MATKTISIKEEAYERLASLRKGNESFSEIISRITGKVRLRDFFGILSKEEGERLEENIKKIREVQRRLYQKRIQRLKEMFD